MHAWKCVRLNFWRERQKFEIQRQSRVCKSFAFKIHFNKICSYNYIICVICIHIGEVVHITVMSPNALYTNIENTSPEYQCYPSAPDENATLEFGRTAPIPGKSEPDPPADGPHQTSAEIRVVTFPDTSEWDQDGFGPFFCQGTKEGKDVTKVTTFFQRSDSMEIYSKPIKGME